MGIGYQGKQTNQQTYTKQYAQASSKGALETHNFHKNTYFDIKYVAKSVVKKRQSLVNEIASFGLTLHLRLHRAYLFGAKLLVKLII